ncbi:P-loop containing nucleoside triphosphate hydrolase protein [Dunaliella salina]|uniref:P-loop containing nucleoside triphosphate hydrolase protein n=1 Tax=Dunaliella salina TaxID=3046 RepID=A0ABQ7FZL8_DUNSA|nr:P-loop containing nucleoside triphosphate hydrolase protein [Dunaliella salina]|eukprot:KAF5827788.1 P-loop containing nucleoside triphosphate hydrolase protein [Dunaliella salina]
MLMFSSPAASSCVDLQVNMLRPQLLGTYHEFGQRYCTNPGVQPSYPSSPYAAPEYRGACRLTELNQRLTAAVMIRRQKDDVASQLPDKIRQKVPIEAEGNAAELRNISTQLQENPVREASNTQEEQGLDEIARTMGIESDRERSKRERNTLLTAYWRATGPAKIKGGVAFLNDLLDRGDVKVLVFAHHQAVLDAYEDAMRKAKVGFVRIDGSSNDAHRKSAVDAFQTQKGTRVALLSITAAAVGLTLNAAQACLFAELHWTPSLLMQAEDRAHRIGVKSSVTCYYLIAKNTADDIMWPMINSKLSVIGTLIDGRSGQGSGMESGAGGALPSPQAAKRQRSGLDAAADESVATPKKHHSEQVIVISDDD